MRAGRHYYRCFYVFGKVFWLLELRGVAVHGRCMAHLEEAVVRSPLVQKLSLTPTGMPDSGEPAPGHGQEEKRHIEGHEMRL